MDQTLAHELAIAGAAWDWAMPELTCTVPHENAIQVEFVRFQNLDLNCEATHIIIIFVISKYIGNP